jgi:hypothetical protein
MAKTGNYCQHVPFTMYYTAGTVMREFGDTVHRAQKWFM